MKSLLRGVAFAVGILTIVASGPGPDPDPQTSTQPISNPPQPTFTLSGTSNFGKIAELKSYGEATLISTATIDEQGNYSFSNVEIEDGKIYEIGNCLENGFCLKSLMPGEEILTQERVYVSGLTDLVYAMANDQPDLPLLGGPPFKLEFGGYGPPCWADRNGV